MAVRQADAQAFIASLRQQVSKLPEMAAQQARATVAAHRERVLAEQTARSGGIHPDLVTIWVDGVRGGSIEAARPPKVVTLDWNYLTEAVIRTVGHLRLHGPETSGSWKEGILVLVNGAERDPAEPLPKDATEATVAVTAPYGRRLEVGNRAEGGPFVLQVEQHFVEHAAIKLNSDHGDLAKFSFTYVDLTDGRRLTERWQHRRIFQKGKLVGIGSTKRRGERADVVKYPAIRIRENQL